MSSGTHDCRRPFSDLLCALGVLYRTRELLFVTTYWNLSVSIGRCVVPSIANNAAMIAHREDPGSSLRAGLREGNSTKYGRSKLHVFWILRDIGGSRRIPLLVAVGATRTRVIPAADTPTAG